MGKERKTRWVEKRAKGHNQDKQARTWSEFLVLPCWPQDNVVREHDVALVCPSSQTLQSLSPHPLPFLHVLRMFE